MYKVPELYCKLKKPTKPSIKIIKPSCIIRFITLRRRAKSPGAEYPGAAFELYCLEILSPSAEQGEGGEHHEQGEKAASSCGASASASAAAGNRYFEGADVISASLGAGDSPLVH